MEERVLTVENLDICLYKNGKYVAQVVENINFKVFSGAIIGIIGESGSGKTVISKSIINLLSSNLKITKGSALFDGIDLFKLRKKSFYDIRGKKIALIPQDSLHALNPLHKLHKQISETRVIHEVESKGNTNFAVNLLRKVGIHRPEDRANQYPHQFSGGMKQRAVIASSMSIEPKLIIADEPTTALDVTVQKKIINLIKSLKSTINSSFIFISHNLGLVSEICDRIYVVYAGRIVEEGTVKEIFSNSMHPYTRALIESTPNLNYDRESLVAIPGNIPSIEDEIRGCRFKNRCSIMTEKCSEIPDCRIISDTHKSFCWNT